MPSVYNLRHFRLMISDTLLHGHIRTTRCENREVQDEKFLPVAGLKLTTPESQVWCLIHWAIKSDIQTTIKYGSREVPHKNIFRTFSQLRHIFLVITGNHLEITRNYLVITRNYLVITRNYLVITRNYLVITRNLSRNYEKLSRNYEISSTKKWILVSVQDHGTL